MRVSEMGSLVGTGKQQGSLPPGQILEWTGKAIWEKSKLSDMLFGFENPWRELRTKKLIEMLGLDH